MKEKTLRPSQDPIQKCFELYLSLSKEAKLSPVKTPTEPKVGQLREVNIFPPLYLALADCLSLYQESIYEAVVFSEEVVLGWLSEKTPILKLSQQRTLLVALPCLVRLPEEFLRTFTRIVGRLSSKALSKLLEYASTVNIDDRLSSSVKKEYIKHLLSHLAPYNVESLVNRLEKLKDFADTSQIIELEAGIAEALSEYSYLKAATSRKAIKGKNFFAYVEELPGRARVIVYFPYDYVGKQATIKLRGKQVFQGLLETDKIILENLPLFIDYSFLEEELDVQV